MMIQSACRAYPRYNVFPNLLKKIPPNYPKVLGSEILPFSNEETMRITIIPILPLSYQLEG
jgi:hypothetical protein